MNKYKEDIKKQIQDVMKKRMNDEIILRQIVFDYAKHEGLVSASREFDINRPIAYKKIIREEFGLVI